MRASRWRKPSAGAAQRIEIVAEDLQRDLGAHARQHVVEPMRDRLADIDRHRQHREPRRGGRRRFRSSTRPHGLRSTSISEECTPSACSSSSARPVRRPTALTSGTSRMSRSAIRPTRFDSASEMPGLNSMLMVKVPSLNGGRKARGSSSGAGRRDGDRDDGSAHHGALDAGSAHRSSARVAALEHAHQRAVAVLAGASGRGSM